MDFEEAEEEQNNEEVIIADNIELDQNVASSSNALPKVSDAVERFYCDKLRGLQFDIRVKHSKMILIYVTGFE
ncbi:unnamed protein product [Meloidogyne enterolobii]|uniref:Uncharacterized protein n=1 Tax=Meloidogyne enterolobii TaxID=390850 RepID=A0ACB0YUS0_MELEN